MWVKPSQAWYGSAFVPQAHDAYLALYHDQGLIPVKQLAFDRAVNTSIGLPFIRTSPDHGTAFDIAGRGIADATSMKAAIQLAEQLTNQRILLAKKVVEVITYTVNRLNQIIRTSHCLDFLAQAFDVSLDSILFRGVYKRPKVFDDDTATKYPGDHCGAEAPGDYTL
jgi:hypothetical protein